MLGGELAWHLLNVVLLTVAVAPLVLWRYRAAVLDGMQGRLDVPLPVPPPAAPRPQRADEVSALTGVVALLAWERRLRRRVLVAVLAAAFVPALALSALYLHLAGLPMTPAHLYIKAAVLCSAAVPIHALLTATPFARALRLWVMTLVAAALVGVLLSMAQRPFYGKAPTWDQAMNFVYFFQLAALTLWLPMLLGLVVGARRVRGVAPIVLAGLLVFGLAPLLGLRLTQWLTETGIGAEWVLSGIGLDTGFVLLALPAGAVAWWRLKTLANGYEAKQFSDLQLLARSAWVLVVASQAVELISVYPGTRSLLTILVVSMVAALMFPALLAATLRRAHCAEQRPPARTLLLLRVFGDTARSEALFDRMASRWCWFGPVTMIAAPDVIARTVDAGDFLRFASGRIATAFVTTEEELQQRLAAIDDRPDPDGRYRVSEFCCLDNSWQATVAKLIEGADATVMDLRGFGAQRRGCEFELGELSARSRADQVVLLVDASTDRGYLEPMLGCGDTRFDPVEIGRRASLGIDTAFEALLGAAYGRR